MSDHPVGNPPATDLSEVIDLAKEDIDAAAERLLGAPLPPTLWVRVIHWLARAHDAGKSLPRRPKPK